MIYFKKVVFNYTEKRVIEAAFRKSAIKTKNLLKLELSKSDIGTDKLFFGYENNKALYFCRIKSSVEFILPNIIIKLPKDETSFYYAFRLSKLAFVVFSCLVFGLLFSLASFIAGDIFIYNLIMQLILVLVFLSVSWVELRLTSSQIKKAIAKQQSA